MQPPIRHKDHAAPPTNSLIYVSQPRTPSILTTTPSALISSRIAFPSSGLPPTYPRPSLSSHLSHLSLSPSSFPVICLSRPLLFSLGDQPHAHANPARNVPFINPPAPRPILRSPTSSQPCPLAPHPRTPFSSPAPPSDLSPNLLLSHLRPRASPNGIPTSPFRTALPHPSYRLGPSQIPCRDSSSVLVTPRHLTRPDSKQSFPARR